VSRYVPTAAEQRLIDRLTLAGYAVVRQRTYDRLKERVALAERVAEWQTEWRASNDRYSEAAYAELRRLADRLTAVAAAAASLGVSIQAINEALDGDA